MKKDELLDLIGEAQEEYIQDAATAQKRKLPRWAKWSSALAACLVVAVGVGGFLLPRMGGSNGAEGSNAHAYDGVNDGATEFMSYAGPVFPLTSLENAEGITAQRELTMDFAPWVPVWYSNEERAAQTAKESGNRYQDLLEQYNEWHPDGGFYRTSTNILVTDRYTLSNTTNEDMTLTALYPFASSLNDLDSTLPTLTADGKKVECDVIFGSYSGGFQSAVGADVLDELINLKELTSWTAYQALLEDGSYLAQTFHDPVDFSGIAVTVYEFSNFSGPERSDDVPNPSILASFTLDHDNTTVLTYGFDGCSWDRTTGILKQGFSIPREGAIDYGKSRYLIVLGDDIEHMELKGYVTGDPEGKCQELDYFHTDVQRYETDLDTILRVCIKDMFDKNDWVYRDELTVDFDAYYALFCDHMTAYGVLSENGGIGRYDTGWLEEFYEVSGIQRVCYLMAEITIPAGENVTVTAEMEKQASFDYHCGNAENQGLYGYDAVTKLGSTLTFIQQSAQILPRDVIEIIRQNFGFDLENGVTQVILDLDTEHYYLEVRRLSE